VLDLAILILESQPEAFVVLASRSSELAEFMESWGDGGPAELRLNIFMFIAALWVVFDVRVEKDVKSKDSEHGGYLKLCEFLTWCEVWLVDVKKHGSEMSRGKRRSVSEEMQ
jgi:hypothetical protein